MVVAIAASVISLGIGVYNIYAQDQASDKQDEIARKQERNMKEQEARTREQANAQMRRQVLQAGAKTMVDVIRAKRGLTKARKRVKHPHPNDIKEKDIGKEFTSTGPSPKPSPSPEQYPYGQPVH